MYLAIASVLGALACVIYFIRLGKKLQSTEGLRAGLEVHARINKKKKEIKTKYEKKLTGVDESNPRAFFSDGRGVD